MKRRLSLALVLSALVGATALTVQPVPVVAQSLIEVSLTTSVAGAGDRFFLLVTVRVLEEEPALVDVTVNGVPGARLVGFQPLGTEYCFGMLGQASAIRCWSHRSDDEPMFFSAEYESHPEERDPWAEPYYTFEVGFTGNIAQSSETVSVIIDGAAHHRFLPMVVR